MVNKVFDGILFRIATYVKKRKHLKHYLKTILDIDQGHISVEDYKSRGALFGKGCFIFKNVTISHPSLTKIGNNVFVGENSSFSTAGGLVIGDNSHLSRNITILTSNHDYKGSRLPYDEHYTLKPVIIGKNVWIAHGVIVKPGVHIGEGAIIGAGAIIEKDVPQLAIVSGLNKVVKYRDENHYNHLEKQKLYGGLNGRKLEEEEIKRFNLNLGSWGDNLFFVVSTGRSGSTAIANTLNQHSQITCLHEPFQTLISISAQYEHGYLNRVQVKARLETLFFQLGVYKSVPYFGISDQRLSNLIEIIYELMPEAKWIWMIRNGFDVAKSFYNRSNYIPDAENKNRLKAGKHGYIWIRNEINGYLAGEMEKDSWEAMSPFQKNCWYWSYWNSKIETSLSKLPKKAWKQKKLEAFNESIDELQDFLGVERESIQALVKNVGKRKRKKEKDKDLLKQFNEICGADIKKWYPEIK